MTSYALAQSPDSERIHSFEQTLSYTDFDTRLDRFAHIRVA